MVMFQLFKSLVYLSLAIISFSAYSGQNSQSLTIYSMAVPGYLSADLYRPTPNGTNYNTSVPGYAIVRDQREIELKEGKNKISFSDVAAFIDPTTVVFKSLTDPEGTTVSEQDFNFDLINNQRLLEKYLGSEISVDQSHGSLTKTFTGKLLSHSGGLILQGPSGKFISIDNYSNVHFPDLPGGLTTKPTLAWQIDTKKFGKHNVETSYQTSGITWWADYNATYDELTSGKTGTLNLSAWISIVNRTGTNFENAKLKLVAGDVNRIKNPIMSKNMNALAEFNGADRPENPSFNEKPFFEFHLYTLNGETTISNNSTKQLELFPQIIKIPVKKQYIYYGSENTPYYGYLNTNADFGKQSNNKVNTYLKFKNNKSYGLGFSLPSGRIRINKIDHADNSLEFIGEDVINHTAKDEEVQIKMGNTFDVVAERKQMDFKNDEKRHVMEESFEITIKNHKEQDVEVTILENLYRWSNWQILNNNLSFNKVDSQSIEIPLTVKKGSQTTFRYTVRYNW